MISFKSFIRPGIALNGNKHSIRFCSEINPFTRMKKVLKRDVAGVFTKDTTEVYPEHTDIVIIGGGILGSAIAFWLKKRTGKGLDVTVLEKNTNFPAYNEIQSLGTLTQHHSLHENIYLSLYSADFLRNIKEHMQDSKVDIEYKPTGNLVLASEKYATALEQNVALQRELGVRNEIISKESLKSKFPWINTDDVSLGCIGSESEGYFNPSMLLYAFVQKAKAMGVRYVNAEVTGFDYQNQHDVLMEGIAPGSYKKIFKVKYRNANKEEYKIKFSACVLAAGHESPDIAKHAFIGTGPGMLSVPLPIQKKTFDVFTLESKAKLPLGLDTPRVQDSSGLWFRRNGINEEIICSHYPLEDMDSVKDSYSNLILPPLINRVPNLENLKVKKSKTEWHDFNTFDDTGILGPHPYHNNLYLAMGFGNLGVQHAPGIGRAIAELLIDSNFTTIELTRIGFDRLLTADPMIEESFY